MCDMAADEGGAGIRRGVVDTAGELTGGREELAVVAVDAMLAVVDKLATVVGSCEGGRIPSMTTRPVRMNSRRPGNVVCKKGSKEGCPPVEPSSFFRAAIKSQADKSLSYEYK